MTENSDRAPVALGGDSMRLLDFEALLADFSAAFVAALPSDLDGLMTKWLLQVVEFLDLDRSSVGRFRPDGTLELAHFAALPGVEPATDVPFEQFDWYLDELRRGRTIVLARLPDDLPSGAAAERQYAVRSGIKANLSIPLSVGGERVGVIGFAGFRHPRAWPPEIFHRLPARPHVASLTRSRTECADVNPGPTSTS